MIVAGGECRWSCTTDCPGCVPGLALYRDMRGQLVGVIRHHVPDLDLSYVRTLGVIATTGDGIATFRRSAQLDAFGKAAA